jgi:1-phosphofructokinase family hexose kinase
LLTVTPNPTVDRILELSHLTAGVVHRATHVLLGVGGKGLNVARAAQALGARVVATAPLAGHSGRLVADLAAAEGLSTAWHWRPAGETRTCVTLIHASGDATVINEPGEELSEADWVGFARHVERLAEPMQAVAFCGSLPPGVAPAKLGALARSLVSLERTVYLDTSAAVLAVVLAQPAGLCLKVNQAELAGGLGLAVSDFSPKRVIEVGRELLERGAALVVVTLGAAGAVAISPEGCWQASAPPVQVVSSAGGGDALLAGLVVARMQGQSVAAALALGVACGTANALASQAGRVERGTVEALLKEVNVNRKA